MKIRENKEVEAFLPQVCSSPHQLCIQVPVRFGSTPHGGLAGKGEQGQVWIPGAMGVGGWPEAGSGQKAKCKLHTPKFKPKVASFKLHDFTAT